MVVAIFLKSIIIIRLLSEMLCAATAAYLSRRMTTQIVSKSTSHAIERFNKRVQQKAMNKSMRNDASISVIGNHSPAFNPCIVVKSEGNHYMFNCPPGAIRLTLMNKIKISNLENVFITNRTWDQLSGIFGVALTIQSMGSPNFELTSADGIEKFFGVSNSFLKFSTGIECKTRTPSDGDYVDSSIRVRPIVIDDHARIEPNGDDSDGNKRARYGSKLLVYLCTLPNILGSLDPKKCRELKVPVGPLLGQLKSGFDVTLPDGTTVKSKDVTGPSIRGLSFLVMDCPHEDIIERLANNDQLEKARKSRLESDALQVDFVLHLCPPPVFENPAYQQWIAGFSESCKHFYVTNPDTKLINFIECYRLQYLLNQIDDRIFPLLHVDNEQLRLSIDEDLLASKQKFEQSSEAALDAEVEPTWRIVGELNQLDTVTKLKSLDKITLRPRQILETLDASNSLDLVYKEAAVNPHYKGELEKLRQLQANLPEAKDYEPELVFLGTGSAAPSKYRNSSCILINFNHPRNASVILDCGEDSYGQLLRHYGPSKTDQILKQLDLIYVSHQHADHHVGLIQLLSKRNKLTDRPVTLIVPPHVIDLLRFYDENFEDLSTTYRVYQSRYIRTFPLVAPASESVIDLKNKLCDELGGLLDGIDVVQVDHCSHSCAVVLHFNIGHPEMSKFSVAYSGDARPCEEFVIVGKNCDLLIHEATFDDKSQDDALAKKHCTSKEAIKMGKDMKAKFTLLTHFSQKLAKVPCFTDDFDDNVGFAFDNLSVKCPSHFGRLPILKPMLSLVFKKSLEEIDLKHLKHEQRARNLQEVVKKSLAEGTNSY